MVLVGYFLVQYVDFDNGQYNILLAQKTNNGTNMVAAWTKDKDEYKEGDTIYIRMEGECSRVYEVLEGNGKRGTAWAPEDDWYLNGRPYICNAEKVERIQDDGQQEQDYFSQ
jgi:hypothetical protein